MDSALKYVDVRVKPWIYVPNVFTPNADGNNDFFSVKADCIVDFEVLILNRWGEIMYRSNDVNFQWDGTYMGEPAQDSVHVYKMFARDYSGVGIPLKGDVTLLR
jgi:gliding motility-associated-like protein